MIKTLFVLALCGFACCSNYKRSVQLIPLFPYERAVKLNAGKDSSKTKYYFLENYDSYETDSSVIDKFIIDHIDKDYKEYERFAILVYQKSQRINKNYNDSSINGLNGERVALELSWRHGLFVAIEVTKKRGNRYYFKKGSDIFNSREKDDFADEVVLEEIKKE